MLCYDLTSQSYTKMSDTTSCLPPPRPPQDKTLYHPVSTSCVDSSPTEHRVFMNTCDPSSPSQQWIFERTNATVLENFNRGRR